MTSRINNLIVNRPEIMENGLHISVKIPANSSNGYRYKVKLADQNVRPYHQIILLKSVVVNTSAQIPVGATAAGSLFALNCDFGNMIGTNYNVTNGSFAGDRGVVVVPINQSQKSTILNLSGGVVFKLNKPILPAEFDIIFTRHDTETADANLPNTDIYIYMYFEYYQRTE